ncbi:Major Facilitator Superfamily (MFS) [Achlya hypogyna]|uniref:Major Facilitator Superfamily (MFS) n=1 Tax=Achlya hypogyna TaxID=1202772 RepID=A0A1V9ZTH2_ACHHY|nr:Major Facilitator Superfamily (MFS) [Achlya hypogyna]
MATRVFGLLCAINLLNFIDRGVIPGAPIEFQAFVQSSYGVSPEHVSVYLGLLASAFIASYSVSICVFGYLSITRRPFDLAAAGLFVWVIALVLCGLAKPLNSFHLLLLGRLISGIGESSFHATTPAFIDEFAPRGSRTLWLGCFYAGMPAGTAMGYSYGSVFAQTVGWDVGFYVLGLAMLPLAVACWRCIPAQFNHPLRDDMPKSHAVQDTDDDATTTADDDDVGHLLPTTAPSPTSVVAEVTTIIRDPLFATASLGLAAFAFTTAGLGAFAPSILIGYGLLDARTAPTVFGALVVVTGVVGSPIGGLLLDRHCRSRPDDVPFRIYAAAVQMLLLLVLGVGCLLLSLACVASPVGFFGLQTLGLFALFAAQAATTLVVLLAAARAHRGLAMALNTFVLHALGDVPSPLVLGALKDYWAPHCGSVEQADGTSVLDPRCRLESPGLTKTLLFAYLWLLLAVGSWSATVVVARRRLRRSSGGSLVPCPRSSIL